MDLFPRIHYGVTDWWETVIVYATEDKIKLLNVTTNTASTILDKVNNITALAIANDYTYHALKLPNNKGCIFKTLIHSGKSERIIDTGSNVTSLEVDYITNNVYFTTNGSLSVCKNDGSICLELDCCDVSEMTLAPKSGLMFYLKKQPKVNGFVLTKSSKGFIVTRSSNGFVLTRSSMVGDNKITFVEDVYYADIFSFVVDEPTRKLYLLETIYNIDNAKIRQISFDTGFVERTIITTVSVRTFGIYDGRVFFTSWKKRYENFIFFTFSMSSLEQANWNDADEWKAYYITYNNSASMNHLNVKNGILHNNNENPCDKSSCSGLCLLRYENSSKFHSSYTCLFDNFTQTAINHRRS